MFERFDASESRVTFSPQIGIFQRAFERNRVAFSLDTFFWQGKRKYLAKGEIFAKRCNRRSKNDANKQAIHRINDRFWHRNDLHFERKAEMPLAAQLKLKSPLYKKIRYNSIVQAVGCVLLLLALTGCNKNEVGDVLWGLFTTKDIKLVAFTDPIVTGVTCLVSSIEANLDCSDPSDSTIACRQTGPITAKMIAQIDKSKNGEVLFTKSKSIFFKRMKIRRIYDAQNQTLMYLSYATKETSGSFKHGLSTV